MEVVIKLNNQTAGRDKLVRLLQYASKVAWHFMQEKRLNRQSVDRLKNLEYSFSSFRKLLRLGRFLDSLYGALATLHYPDLVIRVTCTLSKITNALYLLADHILWIGRTGMVTVNNNKWNKVANKYWLYSIVMNLVRDVYEIWRILEREGHRLNYDGFRRMANGSGKKSVPLGLRAITFVQDHKDIVVDTVKNGCDIFIPMTALGYTRLSPGMIGILGVVSSLAGIISLVDPLAKLSPS